MFISGSASNATDKDSTGAVQLSDITGLLVQLDHLLLCTASGSEAASSLLMLSWTSLQLQWCHMIDDIKLQEDSNARPRRQWHISTE